jgi:hypothetical protein
LAIVNVQKNLADKGLLVTVKDVEHCLGNVGRGYRGRISGHNGRLSVSQRE